ncbi:hypothetical protein FCK90_07920 [Kocuria coralli]|uniref:Uncharacterized protein n=1 Tax=Kocuria coralli TaxID=1461025 RepID=A0A5J5L079_9MICC|nr:permease prefix domain 1-containing protein [Kocuria coralli]KAA9394381.1 hypothetical protein FCK90_07920 [Kocuria coralli]
MTDYTERYVAAVVRRLPQDTQEDVRTELNASIADDIDARMDQGATHEDAERDVLTAMGDPDALSAGYADRPLHLIGPKYYLTWWRLLKLLWIIVLPCAMGGVALAQVLAGAGPGETIGQVIGVTLGAFVHIGFWTTVVFVILERTGADTVEEWTPDNLPEPQDDGAGRGELIASLALLGVGAAALIADRLFGILWLSGDRMMVMNPGLWPWWIAGLFVLIVADAARAIAVYVRRGWTVGLAAFNTALTLVGSVTAIVLLARGAAINPGLVEFFIREGADDDIGAVLAAVLAFAIAAIAIVDIFVGWRRALVARKAC